MSRCSSLWVRLAACGLLLCTAPTLGAIRITADGVDVFLDDGFEDDAVAQPPNAPAIGAYSIVVNERVTNDPSPGPFEGAQYLRLSRPGLNLAADFADVTGSQTIVVRFAMNYVSGCPQISLQQGTGQAWPSGYRQLFSWNLPGANEIAWYSGSAHVPTGLTFTPGVWHIVTMKYTLGAENMDFSIDGNTVTIPVWQPTDNLSHVFFEAGCSSSDTYYLDGAPTFEDTCSDTAPAVGLGTYSLSTAGATTDGVSSCAGSNDVWARFVSPVTGNVQIDTCGSAINTVLSVYSACGGGEVACNTDCAGEPCGADGSCLTLSAVKDQSYLLRIASVDGGTGAVTLRIKSLRPLNDDCGAAGNLTLDTIIPGTTGGATSQGHAAGCGNSNAGPDVWYSYTAQATGKLILDSCGSAIDTVLSVYTGACDSLTQVACDDNSAACGTTDSRLVFDVTAGTTYRIRVAGNDGEAGAFQLRGQFAPNVYQQLLWEADGQNIWTSVGMASDCIGPTTITQGTASDEGPFAKVQSGVGGRCSAIVGYDINADLVDFDQPDGHHLSARLRIVTASGQRDDGTIDPFRGGVALQFLSDTRGGDGRWPAFGISATGLYYLTDFTSGVATWQEIPMPAGLDPTAAFHEYTLQYNAATGNYEFLVDAQVVGTQPRSSAIQRGDSQFGGMRAGKAIAGNTTDVEYDISRIEYAGGLLQTDACTGHLMTLKSGTVKGSNTGANTDGPASCGGGSDVWYNYKATGSGNLLINTCGSAIDTVLSVLDGCGGAELACNDNCAGAPCGGPASCVTVPVTKGNTYKIRVAGAGGATGDYTLTLIAPPPNGICADAIAITGPGAYAGSTVGAAANGAASCGNTNASPAVWYKYTAAGAGTLRLDTCGSAISPAIAAYTGECDALTEIGCNAACPDGVCPGGSSCLAVPITLGTTYLVRVAAPGGASGDFVLNVAIDLRPANDNCADALEIKTGTVAGTTQFATSEGQNGSCGNSAGSGDVWYKWIAPGSGTLTLDTCEIAALDTVISVHTGNCEQALTEIGCNDECTDPCGGPTSCLTVNVEEGRTYLIRVAGNSGTEGAFVLRLAADLAVAPLPNALLVAKNGLVVWQDDGFEDDTAGASPNAPMAGVLTANGVPVVSDAAAPSPFHGTKYLDLFRNPTQPYMNWDFPDFAAGDQMTVIFAMNVTSQCPQIGLRLAGEEWPDSYRQLFTIFTAGGLANQIAWYNGSAHVPTGLTFTPGQWFKLRMDYTLGAAEMTMSLDDQSVTFPVWQPSDTIARIFFETGCGGDHYYLDAAPISNLSSCGDIVFDTDKDGDVDQEDFGVFQACYSGADALSGAACKCMDLDKSGTINSADLDRFVQCASGPAMMADPSCDN